MAGPITGKKGTWRQPSRWGRNESGNFSTVVFEGTRNEITALAGAVAATKGLAYEVSESFGKLRLEVRVPWNFDGQVDPTTDTLVNWEFFGEHSEKHLLDAQVNTGIVATLSTKQKENIRQKYETPPSTEEDATTAKTFSEKVGTVTDGTDPTGTNSFLLYQLMIAGNTGYPMEAPRLRRTIITSNQYALGYALLNVRKLLSTNWVTSNESLEPNLLFNVSSYVAGDVSTDAKLVYAWYKPFPTIQQIALLKWQIVQEFHYGWWPLGTFGVPL